MKQKKTYFVLNKESDYEKGWGSGICVGPEGITLKEEAVKGVYYTKILDSRERGMIWHRLLICGTFLEENLVSVTVYSAEDLGPKGETGTIQQIIHNKELSPEQKEELLFQYRRAEYTHTKDVLLHAIEGRYLWLKFVFYHQGGPIPSMERIQVFFPKQTWLYYLPEVYQEDRESASFIERYLGIFQSFYEDMTEQIDRIPELLDAESGECGLLDELADWFSIENQNIWTREQLGYLIKNAVRIAGSRGTPGCLKELVKLYTGREPYVIEYHQIRPFFDNGRMETLLKKLYGSSPYEFTVLLDADNNDSGSRQLILQQIVDKVKPAHMASRIISLKPYIFLDRYSYLGMNSVLGQYKPFRLDGLCAIPFSVISGPGRSEREGETNEKS